MKKEFLLIISFLLLSFMACKQSKQEKKEPINGDKNSFAKDYGLVQTQWQLIKIGATKPKLTDTENSISIVFDKENSHFAGFSGCNRYFGKYENKKGVLKLDNIGSTMMACPEEDMNFETNYLNSLQKVDSYLIKEDTLFLNRNNKSLLIFLAK